MASKRPKRLSKGKGLAPGVRLARDTLPDFQDDAYDEKRWPWGWLDRYPETNTIGDLEKWGVCFGSWDCCAPRHSSTREPAESDEKTPKKQRVDDPPENDEIIVIDSDEDTPRSTKRPARHKCSRQHCKKNPNCVNWIGDIWHDQAKVRAIYMKNHRIHQRAFETAPSERRLSGRPVGLKNFGATCYANALLQTWFHNLSLRKGVYSVQIAAPSASSDSKSVSPIQALQQTFAGLQLSNAKSYNPKVLIECLGLQHEVQQDALEFSKLFIALLAGDDNAPLEAANSSDNFNSLKGFIASQFEGIQSYNTRCAGCGNTTSNQSSFLELDVPLTGNGKLEDLISATLQPEKLDGDNRYACSRCDTLQEAERWVEHSRFGNVLHISLLRFAFDPSTLDRRKVKARVSIPLVLDMKALRQHKSKAVSATSFEGKSEELIYDLRGVLIHKGASAHHGHYECVVWNAIDHQWYRYDDETVTPLGASCVLGERKSPPVAGKGTQTNGSKSQNKRKRQDAVPLGSSPPKSSPSKGTVVPGTDDEIEILDPETVQQSLFDKPESPHEENYVTSRDAYMLIYTLRQGAPSTGASSTAPQEPRPPDTVRQIIEAANQSNAAAWLAAEQMRSSASADFESLRSSKLSVLEHWAIVDTLEPSLVVDNASLLAWVDDGLEPSVNTKSRQGSSVTLVEGDAPRNADSVRTGSPMDVDAPEDSFILDNTRIVCAHGQLDPRAESSSMKRIRISAFDAINPPVRVSPTLRSDEVCSECFSEMHAQRLLALRHNASVATFEAQLSSEDPSPGAWVSKAWLRDWTSKFTEKDYSSSHWIYEAPPQPDKPEYFADIICQHGSLQPDSARRQEISGEACAVLSDMYATWNPIPATYEEKDCQICSEHAENVKLRAAKERKLYQAATGLATFIKATNPRQRATEDGIPLAMVPKQFMHAWKNWLHDPKRIERPISIDNSIFLCEHGQLAVDPEASREDADFEYIPLSAWNALHDLYSPVGPALIFHPYTDVEEENPEVCSECLSARQLDFLETTLRIVVVSEAPATDAPDVPTAALEQQSSSTGRIARSTRNRSRQSQEMKITVNKYTTIGELRRIIAERSEYKLDTRRLYYRGQVFENDIGTVGEVGIIANAVIYLVKPSRESPDENAIVIDLADDTEKGFSGTMLHRPKVATKIIEEPQEPEPVAVAGAILNASDSKEDPGSVLLDEPDRPGSEATEIPNADPPPEVGRRCPRCTFINTGLLSSCEICDGLL